MNTTSAPIGARRVVTTNPLWQYDYGQKLVIKGVDLPTSYEVLFGTTGDLTPVLGDANGVDIPDALLQEGNDIKAYLFLHTGEDDGEVEYVINIPVKQRPKTSEEPLTPVEQNIIEQAIAVLNLAMDKTTEYMQTTKGYRDEAEGFKDQASTSEYNASVSEDNAHASEVNALTYARRAETAESNVSVIETRVEGYIQTATELNERLEGYSEEVSEALEDISEAKTDALNGISSAKTQAVDDVTSEGARQIGLVTEEGTDQVEAVQNEGQTQVEAVQSEGTTQVNAVRTEGGTQITNIEQKGADVLSRIPYFAPIITDTAEGSIASFTDGADDYPIKSLKVNITPKQSGSGDPSPSNVRPISGWSGVNVNRTGKNLILFDDILEPSTTNTKVNIQLPYDSYVFSFDIDAVRRNTDITSFFMITRADGTERYITDNNIINVIDGTTLRSAGSNPKGRYYFTHSNTIKSITALFRSNTYAQFSSGTIKNLQLELGSTATAYEPYQGESKSIPFKDSEDNTITVYGGEIDVVSGEGLNKKGYIEFDGSSDEVWGFSTGRAVYAIADAIKGAYHWNLDSNYLKPTGAPNSAPPLWEAVFNQGGVLLIGIPTSITSVDEWKAYLLQNPLQLAYELANPTPIYCEPTEIKTLKGNNNIWCDTGDISVEYPADTKLYIDKKIGEL